jgi:hypothetical protein
MTLAPTYQASWIPPPCVDNAKHCRSQEGTVLQPQNSNAGAAALVATAALLALAPVAPAASTARAPATRSRRPPRRRSAAVSRLVRGPRTAMSGTTPRQPALGRAMSTWEAASGIVNSPRPRLFRLSGLSSEDPLLGPAPAWRAPNAAGPSQGRRGATLGLAMEMSSSENGAHRGEGSRFRGSWTP